MNVRGLTWAWVGGFLACCSAAVAVAAQTPAARELSVVTGRGELLTFRRDVHKVVVSEPKIADAIVVSPTEVMVNGKAPGNTTLIVWETGSVPVRWDVRVKPDETCCERGVHHSRLGVLHRAGSGCFGSRVCQQVVGG